jgi:hypothetical protein
VAVAVIGLVLDAVREAPAFLFPSFPFFSLLSNKEGV